MYEQVDRSIARSGVRKKQVDPVTGARAERNVQVASKNTPCSTAAFPDFFDNAIKIRNVISNSEQVCSRGALHGKLDADSQVFGFEVFQHAMSAAFAPQTALLHSSEGCCRVGHQPAINGNHSAFNASSHPHCA